MTKSRIAFADAAVRDAINAGFKALCKGGEYDQLLKQCVPKEANMCERSKQ